MIIAGLLVLLGGATLIVLDTLMTALGLADVLAVASPVVDVLVLGMAGIIALMTLFVL
jgi:hypothetical protein